MTARTVLLVDDAESARATMAGLLELSGYVVVEARSLKEGRRLAAEATYAAAIVDLALGDGDGAELIWEISQARPQVVVAVLSGADARAVAGARLVMTKLEDPRELISRLDVALTKAEV